MFGADFVAKSGVEVFESGLRSEERDSSLSFNDFTYAGGKDAGYIMVSPSGMKNFAKAIDRDGVVSEATLRTYVEAHEFMINHL